MKVEEFNKIVDFLDKEERLFTEMENGEALHKSYEKQIDTYIFSFDYSIWEHESKKKYNHSIANIYVYCSEKGEIVLTEEQEDKLYKIGFSIIKMDYEN